MNQIIFVFLAAFVFYIQATEILHHIVLRSTNDIETQIDDDWWRTGVFYQIYPRSFKDSNGDGTGDIPGIIEKLDYIKELGVSAIWLSPIFRSPQVDQGYDISDFYDVDKLFGTKQDLLNLINKAHELGIKVILDYVPNHTSAEHEWFQKSITQEEGFDDWFVWMNGTKDTNGNMQPPNNWVSCFGGSAWRWSAVRQQYYLHQFASAQPDLNYRNPNVVKAMKDVLTYWMEQGADGFRMDAVTHIMEEKMFRDEPLSGVAGQGPEDYGYLKHIYTNDVDETYDVIYDWRALLDKYNAENKNYTRVMMTETYTETEEDAMRYYRANATTNGAHFTFNFNFITDLKVNFTVDDIIRTTNKWLSMLPKGYPSNWVLGNHDNPRIATRLGKENVDAFNMLAAFLPGIQVTYMGEELGFENGEVTCEEGWDPQAIKNNCSNFNTTSRDFERTPFQWDDTKNAGFSTANKTWLPVSQKYLNNNVKDQDATGVKSHLSVYKSLINFRNNFKNISYDAISLLKLSEDVLQILRTTDRGTYSLLFNAGNTNQNITAYTTGGKLKVLISSVNSSLAKDDSIEENHTLKPHECLIVELQDFGNKTNAAFFKIEFSWTVLLIISLYFGIFNIGVY